MLILSKYTQRENFVMIDNFIKFISLKKAVFA